MIEIRPLTHSDRAAVEFALRRLGERSRYLRYLVSYGPPLRGEVNRLLTVDHWHHEVLIAFHTTPRTPIAVAEYVRTDRFDEAEIAVAVTDAWQRHGVGRELVSELRRRAVTAGIARFTAITLYDNHGALALLHELGPTVSRHTGTAAELTVSLC